MGEEEDGSVHFTAQSPSAAKDPLRGDGSEESAGPESQVMARREALRRESVWRVARGEESRFGVGTAIACGLSGEAGVVAVVRWW